MNDLQRAIRLYEDAVKCPCDKYAQIILEALREKEAREKPRPLTLDELLSMDGEPVYIVEPNDRYWELSGDATDYIDETLGGRESYGKTYTAYAAKPKEAE